MRQIMKKLALLVLLAFMSSLAALWIGYKHPVGWKIGRWYFSATPVDIVAKEMQRSKDDMRPFELDLDFVDLSTMAATSQEINDLYMSIMDSLSNESYKFVDPIGCIRTYSIGDSVATTLEYYLRCDCSMSTSMDVLYISVDLTRSSPTIKDDLLRGGVLRSGYPEVVRQTRKGE